MVVMCSKSLLKALERSSITIFDSENAFAFMQKFVQENESYLTLMV